MSASRAASDGRAEHDADELHALARAGADQHVPGLGVCPVFTPSIHGNARHEVVAVRPRSAGARRVEQPGRGMSTVSARKSLRSTRGRAATGHARSSSCPARPGRPGSRSGCRFSPSWRARCVHQRPRSRCTEPPAAAGERNGGVVGALEQQRAQQVRDRHPLARAQVDARLRRRRRGRRRRAAVRSSGSRSSASSAVISLVVEAIGALACRRRGGRARGRRARRPGSRPARSDRGAAARSRPPAAGPRPGAQDDEQERARERQARARRRSSPGCVGRAARQRRMPGRPLTRGSFTRWPVTRPCGSSVGLSAAAPRSARRSCSAIVTRLSPGLTT